MESKFNLQIVTPFQKNTLENIDSLYVDTDNGRTGILAGHADLISSITKGKSVVKINNKETTYNTGSGFVEFDNKKNTAKIVVNMFVETSKIQISNTKQIVDKIDTLLKNNKSLDAFSIKYLENQKIAITE